MLKKKSRFSSLHTPDIPLLVGVLALLIFGLVLVYDSSAPSSSISAGNQYHFLELQLVWVVLGLVAMFIFYRLDYHPLRRISLPLFLIAIALLVLVVLPTPFSGVIRGSKRWLSFPISLPFLGESANFQPSEFVKLALILYLASLFSANKKVARFLSFLVPTALVVGLEVLEPDLGTAAATLALGVATFFFAEGSFVAALFLTLASAVGLVVVALSDPARAQRITSFLNPGTDVLSAGYQIQQILIALGSGGLFGLGIGQSRQKYSFIPDIQTDAIFAVIGEEFGFVGALAVIALFAFIIYRGLRIAQSAPDGFGKIIAGGITSWVGIQALMNLGAMTGLIPLKGISLPLISYGGSSLVVLLAAFGILLNVSRQTVVRRK